MREKFIKEPGKFTNPQKISPSKILGYTVLSLNFLKLQEGQEISLGGENVFCLNAVLIQ